MPGKFDSTHDELIYQLSLDGVDRAGGHVEAPEGHFALVSIANDELDTVRAQLADLDLLSPDATLRSGHFLVREDNNGFVSVTEYPSRAAADEAFDALENAYAAWDQE